MSGRGPEGSVVPVYTNLGRFPHLQHEAAYNSVTMYLK